MAKKSSNKSTAPTKMAGRPKKDLSLDQLKQVRRMAMFGMTQDRIAYVLSMHPDTLRKYATDAFNLGKAEGDMELLESAHLRAVKGSDVLMKFLLATRCGMSEKTVVVNETPEGTAAPIIRFEVTQAGQRKAPTKATEP